MDRFLVFVLFVILPFTIQQDVEMGICKCAVFPVQEMQLIIERSLPYNFTCNDDGETKCQQFCVAVAEGAKEQAPQIICEKLNTHVEDLRVAVYSRVCDASVWKFTGLKAEDPICCHDGKGVTCGEAPPTIPI